MADRLAPIVEGRVMLSAEASALLYGGHAIAARAFVMTGNGALAFELPLESGSVSCDSGSTVRRSGSLTIAAVWSDSPTSVLAPYGTRVAPERGVRLASGDIEWVRLMTGPIDDVSQTDDAGGEGLMTLTVKDEFATLALDRFDGATPTVTTERVVDAIARIVHRTLPDATVIDLTGSTALCGAADLGDNPADAIHKLATSIGAECYTGRGWQEFVIRPAATLDDPPRWQIIEGEGGNWISRDRKRARSGVYNRVVATQVTQDSSTTAPTPISGEARITDNADPLYYGGPAGRITRRYKSPLITTQAQANAAAAAILEKTRGRNLEVSFTTLVNPALDGGDVIWSVPAGEPRGVHLVDAAAIPLSVKDTQSVSTRSIDLPDEDQSVA